MWDDIVIGKGEKLCSAMRVFDIEGCHGISSNRTAYWISGGFLDIGMTIYREHEMGKRLTKMIAAKKPLADIQAFLDHLVLTRVSPARLKAKIDIALQDAFNDGKEAHAEIIRQALGIRNGGW